VPPSIYQSARDARTCGVGVCTARCCAPNQKKEKASQDNAGRPYTIFTTAHLDLPGFEFKANI
jgi:hypothetical protein